MRLLIVCISVWIAWGPVWGQTKNQSSPPGQPANSKTNQPQKFERGSEESPLFVHVEQDPAGQADTTTTKSATRGKDFYDKLGAWAGAAVALFTLLLVGVGYCGVKAALRTLKAIQRQAELQERSIRPWIGTDFIAPGTVLESRSGLEVTANISIKNTGASVALDGIMLPHLISSEASALQKGINDAWLRTEHQLAARNSTEWETGFVLHPTRSHTHESVMGGSMQFSEMEARRCYILVCVIYHDQFGKEHRTQDCFNVRTQGPGVPPNGIAFNAVPAHQKAD